jgi:hypothetical protein
MCNMGRADENNERSVPVHEDVLDAEGIVDIRVFRLRAGGSLTIVY